MGFMRPKIKAPPPAPNPATPAMEAMGAEGLMDDLGAYSSARSLISTSSTGLRRRASTQRTSLIGG